jgi:hypothetical protein
MSSRVKMPPDTQVYIHVFVLICVLRRTRTRTATDYLNQHSSTGHIQPETACNQAYVNVKQQVHLFYLLRNI